MIIREKLVHDAVGYLTTDGDKAAAAKGDHIRAEFYLKQTRARLILASTQKTNDLRIADAESHKDFIAMCEKVAKCAEEVEKHRNSRSRAETICSMWQTEQSTLRSLGRVA